jgi:hypothetical protein
VEPVGDHAGATRLYFWRFQLALGRGSDEYTDVEEIFRQGKGARGSVLATVRLADYEQYWVYFLIKQHMADEKRRPKTGSALSRQDGEVSRGLCDQSSTIPAQIVTGK